MWKSLSNWFYRVSNGWLALGGVAIFLLFMIFVLPGQSSGADDFSAEAGVPDLSIFYSANDLYRMAETYGEAGRAEYIRARFNFDLIWPLVYAFFLITAISWLYRQIIPGESRWRRVNLVPFFGMIFDFLENIATSFVVWRFPQQTPLVSSLAGVFTLVKWLFVAGSFLILILGLILALGGYFKNWRRAR
jgi:hypothetical protein